MQRRLGEEDKAHNCYFLANSTGSGWNALIAPDVHDHNRIRPAIKLIK